MAYLACAICGWPEKDHRRTLFLQDKGDEWEKKHRYRIPLSKCPGFIHKKEDLEAFHKKRAKK